jgi:two-component system CheB/CheR fusion protein
MNSDRSEAGAEAADGLFSVVGIGASAGGLEALRGLFKAMPADTGAGFVLVQHLDPTHDSLMAELLAKYARIPVVQVNEGMRVEPNRLHVIPPNSVMTISKGVLHLSEPTERRGLRMPIDRFFSSLAEDQQERAIAVVLSGAGTDGTYGVRLVKARGGMVMAQDPTLAGYDGMPRSAVATGDVDYVLPVEDIPSVLVRYIEHFRVQDGSNLGDARRDEDFLNNILALLIARQDYDFRCYKRGTINRRILRRMGLSHVSSLEEYHERLRNDENEVHALAKDLLIGVTSFFRDVEAWQLLRDKVLPELFARLGKDEVMRAWVPGCATGEEAYSLAMVLAEAAQTAARSNNLIVFATDIDRDALEVARNGIYAESLVADIEPDRLKRFFSREGDSYQVKKGLREKVLFAPQNLITDPPFSALSLISCRNLLIYIEPEFQDRLLGLFHFSLREGGCLFLGSSETVGQGSRFFLPVSRHWRIYRRSDTARPPNLEFPSASGRTQGLRARSGGVGRRRGDGYGPLAHKLLLEQFAPASVLVDRGFRVLYYHGAVRDYLGPSPGDPSDDLLALAGDGMRGKLRSLLSHAVGEDRQLEIGGAHVRRGEQWYPVGITVTPVHGSPDTQGLLLVSFRDENRSQPDERHEIGLNSSEDSVVAQLEEDLKAAREDLRATIEQMETSNEELKASNEEVMSMNEELQSTNEELETSKEELQSLNEELTTLNSQLEDKVHELEETNNDLSNLLVSTDIATVFLDRRLRIRRYTPAIGRLMRLIPADVGRVVTDITWRFEDPGLLDDIQAVLAGQEKGPREIQGRDRRWYLRRVLPYCTEEDAVEGVVITFTDITGRKRIEVALRDSESHLRRITDAIPALISYIDSNYCYRFNNATYEQWFGIDQDALFGKSVAEVLGEEAFSTVRRVMQDALSGKPSSVETWVRYAHGGARYVSARYIPDRDDSGAVRGLFALVTDLTEKRRSEERIEQLNAENKQRLDEIEALLDAAPVGIFFGRDAECRDMIMNRAGADMLHIEPGLNPSKSGPDAARLGFRVFHDDRELAPHELPMQRAAARGKPIENFEVTIEFQDGELIQLLTYSAPLFDEEDKVRGCVGTFIDVTSIRAMERRYREAAERLRIHLENTPLAIVEWDNDQVIVNWSGNGERMFGWNASVALGKRIFDLGLIHSDDQDRVGEVVAELLDGRVETNRCLNRNRRRDGTVIWCEWFNSVLRDESGRFLSALSVALEVTERKRLEEELLERTRTLEDADRKKNDFLAMLGHELRNHLAPIRNAVQLAAVEGERMSDVGWVREIIDGQTRHMERMVDDLLDMARIQKGLLNIESKPQRLGSLILDTLAATKAAIEAKGHHVTTDLGDDSLIIMGDATRLIQVFSNLLNNAVRYTPEGGEIGVSLARESEDCARVVVEDNGIGISADLLPHVFDIFNDPKVHLGRSNAGLGLGLSLVKQIVRLHGGEVTAQSQGLGQGSRFVVRLPLVAEQEDPRSQEDLGPGERVEAVGLAGDLQSLDILLVDDNPDIRDSLQRLLSAIGHRVRTLDAGRHVRASVKESPPDLLLLDLGLPDMDGYQVAKELAELPQRKRFKLVAVTGYAEERKTGAQGEGDFDAYLLKPITLDMLRPYMQRD